MANITIQFTKSDILDEVKKTSAYLGAKSQDAETFARVAIVDANDEQLQVFWDDACALVAGSLHRWLKADGCTDDVFDITLAPSSAWNSALESSVEKSLKGYFINVILAKWLMLIPGTDPQTPAQVATGMLQDAETKLYRKQTPTRNVD